MHIIETVDAPWTEEIVQSLLENYGSSEYVIRKYTDKIEVWTYDDYDKIEVIVPDPIPPTPEEEYEMHKEYFEMQFFAVPNFGWYRKAPKGYASAIESLTVAYNMITSNAIQTIPAGTFIFYPQPDYHDAEQCTEDWLVAHQIPGPEMTKEEFLQFYAAFVLAWNNTEH